LCPGSRRAPSSRTFLRHRPGNLLERDDTVTGSSETFNYDHLNRLTNAPFILGGVNTPHGVSYDAIGDITKKVGLCGFVGCMSYAAPGHLHAVSYVSTSTGVTYDGLTHANLYYDANGNLQCVTSVTACNPSTDAKSFSSTSFNMASSIVQGTTNLTLTYDPDHSRSQQGLTLNGGATTTTTYYNDPNANVVSETIHVPSVSNTWKTYIVADGKIVAQRITSDITGTVTMNYFVLDHLGSVAVVFDGTQGATTYNTVIARQFFDAWGSMRHQDGTADTTCSLPAASPSTRGYTNQEEMPNVCLVNYNARIYDPALGRFLSADSTVEAPYDGQDWNRYSYVGNNPLSFNDPSGNCFLGCFWNQSWFKAVVGIAAAFLLDGVILPELEAGVSVFSVGGLTGGLTVGQLALNAGIAGGISGAVTTGKLSGAIMGALEAEAFFEVGSAIGDDSSASFFSGHTAEEFVTHGMVGGLFSAAEGGNFSSGFLAAGAGSLADNAEAPGNSLGAFAENVTEHAVFGGLGSVLGGGKFANGAVTGAFGYLFNQCLHTGCGLQPKAVNAWTDSGTVYIQYDDGTLQIRTGGSLAWRDNNPGNIEATGDNAPGGSEGAIGANGRFAIFPDYATGYQAVLDLLQGPTYSGMTLQDAIARWAPPVENNTAAYQSYVSGASNMPLNTQLSTMNAAQINALAGAIQAHEGFTSGTVTSGFANLQMGGGG
jgi:RHS repeat-associated protein